MARIVFLILLSFILLISAANAGTSLPALLLIGSLVLLSIFITLMRSQSEE